MSGDCKGTIDQGPGEIKITMVEPDQCQGCTDIDCPLHRQGPSENEQPQEVSKEIPTPEPDKLSNLLLKKLGEKSAEVVLEIMRGKVTGFTIITTGPDGIAERGMIGEAAREKAMTHIALNDLEKKMTNLTAQPKGWIDRLLKEVLK